MLKCDVLNKTKDSGIKFEDLDVGSTFIIRGKECGDSYEWIGMKVASAVDWEEHLYYILDLSDCKGSLFDDVEMYNIVRLIDLKVVEDEGDNGKINKELDLILDELQIMYKDSLDYGKPSQSIGIAKSMDLIGRHFNYED